jgi:hypothetical protein
MTDVRTSTVHLITIVSDDINQTCSNSDYNIPECFMANHVVLLRISSDVASHFLFGLDYLSKVQIQ